MKKLTITQKIIFISFGFAIVGLPFCIHFDDYTFTAVASLVGALFMKFELI